MSKTTFKLPRSLRDEMREVAKAEQGPRGKSRWVREAVLSLLETDPGLSTVGLGEDLREARGMVVDQIDITGITNDLESAITLLRRQDPMMEGVQSAILRAAIRHRLKRGKGSG